MLKEYVALKDTKNEKYYNIIDVDIVETIYDGTFNQVDADYKKAYLVDENGNVLKEFKSTFHGTDVVGVFADDNMITGRFYTPIDKNPEMEYPEGKEYYIYPSNRLIDAYETHIYYFAEVQAKLLDIYFSIEQSILFHFQVLQNTLPEK